MRSRRARRAGRCSRPGCAARGSRPPGRRRRRRRSRSARRSAPSASPWNSSSNVRGHADAVLVHREALVGVGARGTGGRPSGSTRRRRTPSAGRACARKTSCQLLDRVDHGRPPRPVVCRRIAGSVLNRLSPSGTTATEASSGYSSSTPASVSSSTSPSLTPGHTTTWPRTSMPWSSRARSQRRLIPPRGFFSIRDAHLGVGGVDADVQRRQALGDHPLEVGLGEAGQRREVPVQEAQPVVVVLQVQAAAQALRQLVDEAELAVVVARAHPVEHRAGHLGAERLAGALARRRRPGRSRRGARPARPRPRRRRSATR